MITVLKNSILICGIAALLVFTFAVAAVSGKLVSTLGFSTVSVPLSDGTEAKLAGIKSDEAASFILAANDAFREHIGQHFDATEDELRAWRAPIG